MSTTQPKDLMTLETTSTMLHGLLSRIYGEMEQLQMREDFSEESEETQDCRGRMKAITSALHHLEAERKECQCDSFRNAQVPCTDHEMFGEAVRTWDGGFIIGPELPHISFCPWCGGKVPTAQETSKPC